jgi:hypothetical protein
MSFAFFRRSFLRVFSQTNSSRNHAPILCALNDQSTSNHDQASHQHPLLWLGLGFGLYLGTRDVPTVFAAPKRLLALRDLTNNPLTPPKAKLSLKEEVKMREVQANQIKAVLNICKLTGRGPEYSFAKFREEMEEKNIEVVTSLSSVKRRFYSNITKAISPDARPYEDNLVITSAERKELVEYLVQHNKEAMGLKPADVSPIVIRILKARLQANKKEDRSSVPLSPNALTVLAKGCVGQAWFDLFHAEFQEELARRKPQPVSIQRLMWCTENVVKDHFARLKSLLLRKGILVETTPGVWRIDGKRVVCKDEMPQPLDGGPGGGRGVKVYCCPRDVCRKLQAQNREHVTVDTTIGMDGHIYWPHVIIDNKTIASDIVLGEDVIENALISNQENAWQDHRTFKASIVFLRKELRKRGITDDVVLLTDGGPGRHNEGVLTELEDSTEKPHISMYLIPPNTSHFLQAPDQIFVHLHRVLNTAIQEWHDLPKNRKKGIGKPVFLEKLCGVWYGWVAPQVVKNSFKKVGITSSGLNMEVLDKSKFAATEAILPPKPKPDVLPDALTAEGSKALGLPAPPTTRSAFLDVLKQNQLLREKINELQRTPISLKACGFWDDPTVSESTAESSETSEPKKKRLKSEWGDFELQDLRGQVVAARVAEEAIEAEKAEQKAVREREKEEREAATAAKKQEKEEEKKALQEAWNRCLAKCVCEGKCAMTGFKRCDTCGAIMKSKCSKKGCVTDQTSTPPPLVPS